MQLQFLHIREAQGLTMRGVKEQFVHCQTLRRLSIDMHGTTEAACEALRDSYPDVHYDYTCTVNEDSKRGEGKFMVPIGTKE